MILANVINPDMNCARNITAADIEYSYELKNQIGKYLSSGLYATGAQKDKATIKADKADKAVKAVKTAVKTDKATVKTGKAAIKGVKIANEDDLYDMWASTRRAILECSGTIMTGKKWIFYYYLTTLWLIARLLTLQILAQNSLY